MGAVFITGCVTEMPRRDRAHRARGPGSLPRRHAGQTGPLRSVTQSTAECYAAVHRGLHLPLAGSLHHQHLISQPSIEENATLFYAQAGPKELSEHMDSRTLGEKAISDSYSKPLPTSQRATRQSGLKIFSKGSPKSLTKHRFTCYYRTSGVGTQGLWVYMHICGEQSGPRPACRLGEGGRLA